MRLYRHPFLRPFLNISKNNIISFNIQHDVSWREDRSNSSNDYARNVIRNEVLPRLEALFPGCSERIFACAADAAELASADPESVGMQRNQIAQLSRRYLDAASKYGINATPPPGTRVDTSNPKPKRASQHQASLIVAETPSVIAAGSYSFFNLDKR
jgi:tRNA(Ile)-lysidine synthase TilS/MesJ